MPTVTRSRKQANKSPDFCVLIDKTPRNIIQKPVRATGTEKRKKPLQVAPAKLSQSKSKSKAKRSAKLPSTQVVGERENTPQLPDIGELDDPLRRVLSAAQPPAVFATPPRSHPPPRPPKLPEHRSYDPKATLPPQFNYDGTPSPDPGRRSSHRVPVPTTSARASPLLPPSSPIHLSSSPARQVDPIFLSAHSPGSPSQFRTPTHRDRKRKRTPLTNPHSQSEGQVNNDDLFAHGVIDDLDEREDSVDWENAGSDKENHGGTFEFPGSEASDNKPTSSMPFPKERGILQPREASLTPARSNDSDPFGFFATERLLKARRAEKMPEAGPSDARRPRRPLGELAFTEVAPTAEPVQITASPSQSQPARASPYRRYSDSEIEDLYAPASPPHTPREHLPQAHPTSPHPESTPVAVSAPLTPRNGDNMREFTVRRRRHKELHDVSEHGSEIVGSSAPSSPSPVKRVHQRPPDPESQVDYDHQESEEEDRRPRKRPKTRRKVKGKENARGKRPITEDPIEAARRILENAPRRGPERRATVTKTSSNPVEGGSSAHQGRTRSASGRRAARGSSGRASRGRKGSKATRVRKKDESTPEDVRETREQERLKRVEYFKQLDGYVLPEEKVYVV